MRVNRIDQRDILRNFERLIHARGRDDVKVTVQFLVHFEDSKDEENYANTILDAWTPVSRPQYSKILDEALKRVKPTVASLPQPERVMVAETGYYQSQDFIPEPLPATNRIEE